MMYAICKSLRVLASASPLMLVCACKSGMVECGDYIVSEDSFVVGFMPESKRKFNPQIILSAENVCSRTRFDPRQLPISCNQQHGYTRVAEERVIQEKREVLLGHAKAICGDAIAHDGKLKNGNSLQLYSCGEIRCWGRKLLWGIRTPIGEEEWTTPLFKCDSATHSKINPGTVSFKIIKQIDIAIVARLYDDNSVDCSALVRDSRIISEFENKKDCSCE